MELLGNDGFEGVKLAGRQQPKKKQFKLSIYIFYFLMKRLKIMSDFEQDLMTNEHVGSQLYTCMIFICLGYSSRKKNILIGGGLRTYLFKIPGLKLLGI